MTQAKLKTRFMNFWPNSSRTIEHFFVPLIQSIYGVEVECIKDQSKKVDLEIHSVFKPQKSKYPDFISRKLSASNFRTKRLSPSSRLTRRIWFSGENIRPPLHLNYDFYLSYDGNSLASNSHYLPLWVLNLNWFGKESAHGFISEYQKQESLLQSRNLDSYSFSEREFCCIFANHLDNTRYSLIKELSKVGQVDLFGYAGKQIVKDKKLVASKYKFILCPENDLYPGYVTEKLLEAYQTKALPIYWGMDTFGFFNPKAYVNVTSFQNVSDLLDRISALNSNEVIFNEFIQSPLLLKPYDFSCLKEKLSRYI